MKYLQEITVTFVATRVLVVEGVVGGRPFIIFTRQVSHSPLGILTEGAVAVTEDTVKRLSTHEEGSVTLHYALTKKALPVWLVCCLRCFDLVVPEVRQCRCDVSCCDTPLRKGFEL